MAQFDDYFNRQLPQLNDDIIQSHNFGGLNTTASAINTPYEDTPYAVNVITDISGNLQKRPGTRLLYKDNSITTDGVVAVPFTSGLQYNLLICKRGTALQIFEILNNVATLVMTKSNVWDSRAQSVKPSVVATSEVIPRLIFTTGKNKPVQLRFVERQSTTTTSTVDYVEASAIQNASASNCLVFVNRVRSSATFSYNAGTRTLTLGSLTGLTGNDIVDLIFINWSWWAEATYYMGSNYYGTTTRFNASVTDQNVKVPTALLVDLTGTEFTYPTSILTYSKGQRPSVYTRVVTRQPQLATEYDFSDGSRYIYAADNYVNPSPYYITFGALEAGSPAPTSTVYFTRRRLLPFRAGNGQVGSKIAVYINNVLKSQSLSAGDGNDTYENYRLFDSAGTLLASAASVSYQISLSCAVLGTSQTSVVEVINKEANHIGSGATTTKDTTTYADGGYVPIYGLGDYVDTYNGYYPSHCVLYQGRLVLTGFANNPLLVLLSASFDSRVPGQLFNYFMVNDTATGVSDPLDLILNGSPDDRIVACVEWQGSLFALTRHACYQLTGGDTPINPTARYVNFVSNTGLVNPQAIVKTDNQCLYLSDNGLYSLQLIGDGSHSYTASELSLKIRSEFTLTTDPRYESFPWLGYDVKTYSVYVGYPVSGELYTCRSLYVYSTYRGSWSRYDTGGGFNTFMGVPYVDRQLGQGFLAAVTTVRSSGVPANFALIKFNDTRYIDYRDKVTYNGSSTYSLPVWSCVIHTANSAQQRYSTTYEGTTQHTAFRPNVVKDVNDFYVVLGTSPSPTDTRTLDYVKEDGNIYLLSAPSSAKVGIFKEPCPYTVYADNVKLVKDTNYTVTWSSQFTEPTLTLVGVATNAVVEYGQMYLAQYTTPLFIKQSFANLKRLNYVYLWFTNNNSSNYYTASDTNASSSQNAEQLPDQYKVKFNVNISLVYNGELSGDTTYDLYGTDVMTWDVSAFDLPGNPNQSGKVALFKEPFVGVASSYQIVIWSNDDNAWMLNAYQVVSQLKGSRYIGRF